MAAAAAADPTFTANVVLYIRYGVPIIHAHTKLFLMPALSACLLRTYSVFVGFYISSTSAVSSPALLLRAVLLRALSLPSTPYLLRESFVARIPCFAAGALWVEGPPPGSRDPSLESPDPRHDTLGDVPIAVCLTPALSPHFGRGPSLWQNIDETSRRRACLWGLSAA